MNYLAIDLGASSGRHIVESNGELIEVHRFYNGVDNVDGHLVWDTERLFKEIKLGIKKAIEKFGKIESLSIDTWGVDYVLLSGDKEITPCYAYRDSRTQDDIPVVHGIVPFEKMYSVCGEQFQEFNTVYQLYDDLTHGRLDNATDFLMMPEYFMYKLTGVKVKEYTEATTTGLVNVVTGEFDDYTINALGLPKRLFTHLSESGETVGELTKEIQAEVGGNLTVKLCPTHDTASAFNAVTVSDKTVILSSGTWSLIGVKNKDAIVTDESRLCNFANEGGVGYFRYLKNIMGMWIINRIKDEKKADFTTIVEQAEKSDYAYTFDVNDKSLVAPDNMTETVIKLLAVKPQTDGDLYKSVYLSLAVSYGKAIKEIENNTGKKYDELVIVGGGAKNVYLNKLTEKTTGIKVTAMPIEATAIGNINAQKEI